MIDEAKRWEAILAQDVTIKGEQGTVTMTMSELLEWLESEPGFLKREMRHAFLTQYQRATVHAAEVRLYTDLVRSIFRRMHNLLHKRSRKRSQ